MERWNRQFKDDLDVKLGDQIIPQVTKFKYLGSIIGQNDEIDDVNHRIRVRWCKESYEGSVTGKYPIR